MISPPVFPDTVHVSNGCYVSALVYLSRYLETYPAEQGSPVAVTLPNAGGEWKPHTLAVMSWHGQWWARDEYFGVFSLSLSSAAPWDPALVQRRAEVALPRNAAVAGLQRVRPRVAESWPPAFRLEQVKQARELLPCPSEIHWQGEVPLLFFRLSGDAFAVYDPAIGTATATAPAASSEQLVAAVAARLGYRTGPDQRVQAGVGAARV